MSFQTKCSKCGFEFEAEEEWIGQEAECPECETTFVIEKFKQETKINSQKTHSQNSIQPSTPPKEINKKFILKCIFIPSATAIFILLALVFLSKSETVKEKTTQVNSEKSDNKDVLNEKTTASPNGKNIGKQGEWNTFTVHYKEGEPKKVDISSIVKEAYFKKEDDNYILTIKWMGENVAKVPSSMTWKSKFLTDKANRVFTPFNGTEVFDVQPLAKSDELIVRYKIPSVVELSDLNWGMYKENEFKYKILLNIDDYKNTTDYAIAQKEAMVIEGHCYITLNNGNKVFKTPNIFLVKRNKETKKFYEECLAGEKSYKEYLNDMNIDVGATTNAGIAKAVSALLKKGKIEGVTTVLIGVPSPESGAYSIKPVPKGEYFLIAHDTHLRQKIYWVVPITKEESQKCNIDLSNSNAFIITINPNSG